MKYYGQRGEDEHILKYFEGQLGTFLEIGSYHPEKFSNVRNLYLQGWKGTLIEPAQSNYEFIKDFYKEDKEMEVVQTCIGTYDGEIAFYDSGGDAISSTSKAHCEKWEKGYDCSFVETQSRVITFDTLVKENKYKKFDFILIDVEGTNWEILQTIDLALVGCRMLCIEYDDKKPDIRGWMESRGYRLYHETVENLIFVLN